MSTGLLGLREVTALVGRNAAHLGAPADSGQLPGKECAWSEWVRRRTPAGPDVQVFARSVKTMLPEAGSVGSPPEPPVPIRLKVPETEPAPAMSLAPAGTELLLLPATIVSVKVTDATGVVQATAGVAAYRGVGQV